MQVLILFGVILTLIGCGSESALESKKYNEKIEGYEKIIEIDQPKLSPDEAIKFGETLLAKINLNEESIQKAYEEEDIVALAQYEQDLFNDMYANTSQPTKSYWIDDDTLNPYLKCDSALGDLYLYTGVLNMQLNNDTDSLRNIVKQEEQDYLRSKAKCEERVAMNYDDALIAYEQE